MSGRGFHAMPVTLAGTALLLLALVAVGRVSEARTGAVQGDLIGTGSDVDNWRACRDIAAARVEVDAWVDALTGRETGGGAAEEPLVRAAAVVRGAAVDMTGPLAAAASSYADAVTGLRGVALRLDTGQRALAVAVATLRAREQFLGDGCDRVRLP